jgi:hypothetical protein
MICKKCTCNSNPELAIVVFPSQLDSRASLCFLSVDFVGNNMYTFNSRFLKITPYLTVYTISAQTIYKQDWGKEPTASIAFRLVAIESLTLSLRSQLNGREWVGLTTPNQPWY